MPVVITTFRNVRARLNRTASDTWLSGWVTHLAREEARLRLWGFVPLTTHERIVCECYGQGTVAKFNGVVIGQVGQDVAIDLIGSIFYTPSNETPRIYAPGLEGTLTAETVRSRMMLMDLSAKSLGVLADAEFRVGQQMSMELPNPGGPIMAKVSVANCRADVDDATHFRVGLHIVDMSRLDLARWSRLVADSAEA